MATDYWTSSPYDRDAAQNPTPDRTGALRNIRQGYSSHTWPAPPRPTASSGRKPLRRAYRVGSPFSS